MFGTKKIAVLGVDISSSAVKVLEIGKRGTRFVVESYAVQPLAEGAVVEGRFDDAAEVSRTIKRAVKQSRTRLKSAAVAVPSSAVITQTISLPQDMTEREIEDQVLLEAEQHVPYPMEEVMLDFSVLGSSKEDVSASDVFWVASRVEYVDTRIAALEDAGLKPQLVDVQAYSVENIFPLISQPLQNQGQGLTVALVDMGATVTTITVLHDGKIVYTRDQTFGGRQLTDDIARHYGLSFSEAGRAKKEHNLPEDYETNVLTPFKQAMTQQVARALQFFFSATRQYQTIDHIILAGGCASIDGLEQMIALDASTECSVANPFSDMVMGSRVKVKALGLDAPALLTACGLAMRSFD